MTTAFENGRVVPACDPREPDEQPEPKESAFELLLAGLRVTIEDGRSRGTLARLAALAVLSRVYATPSEAAQAMHLRPETVCMALRRMRRILNLAAQRHKAIANTGECDDGVTF